MTDQHLLTTGDLAKELGVAAGTVRHYVRQGKIHPSGTTLGGHRRFRLGDVVEELRAQGVAISVQETTAENLSIDVGTMSEADGVVSLGERFPAPGENASTVGLADERGSLAPEVAALAGPVRQADSEVHYAPGDNPVYDRLRRWAGPVVSGNVTATS